MIPKKQIITKYVRIKKKLILRKLFGVLHDLHEFNFFSHGFRVIKSVYIVDFHLVISTDGEFTIQSNQKPH